MSKQKSYASATRVKHDNAVASTVANIASERANCLSFTIPKGTKVSIPEVAQALEKLGEGAESFIPLIEDGTVILQVVEVSEITKKMVQKLIEDGLPLKGITAVISKLPQVIAGGDRVAGHVQNFTPTPLGIAGLKAHLEKFGDLINFRLNRHAGTRIYDRTADFLLNISASHKLPPTSCRIDNETWAEDARISIITRMKFCYFCRSTEHVRKECTVAPACYHCGDRDHAPSRCRNRDKPDNTTYKPLDNWGAYDMPIDDFEVQRVPAQKGSAASIHAPRKVAEAQVPETPVNQSGQQYGQPDGEDNGMVVWPSVRDTESGSPAAFEASVPRSVSNEPGLGKRAMTGVDSSGFQEVKKKTHRGASSISAVRPSPYDHILRGDGVRQRRLSTSS